MIFYLVLYFINFRFPAAKLTDGLEGFDPTAFANEFVSVEEVLKIKKAFDFFDCYGGGSIDPKGNHLVKHRT